MMLYRYSFQDLQWLILFLALLSPSALALDRPNILWLTSEDHGPEMGCYGDKLARTPCIDALAAQGCDSIVHGLLRPSAPPARTAIISGMYPSSSGGLHMRSMVSMPAGTSMAPQLLREAGYYCTNNSKTDYNLRETGKVWDESSGKAHWKNRLVTKPFFAIFNSTKSHESQIRTRPHKQVTSPSDVRVPAYHPDTPEVRADWAQYYDKVSEADADAGRHLKEIFDAGLAEDTIVFYYADHGSGMPRSKRWPCNSGLHVPLIVYFPKKWEHLAPSEYKSGGESDRLVSFVDLAPTVLSLAGVKPPAWMQGNAFAGVHQAEPQPFLFGERGRMDERMDMVRSVTDGRYVYLRNYMPHVSQAQKVAYQFETPTTRIWHDLFQKGKTTPAQSVFWSVPKAPEELYDLRTDRDEIRNLADSPEHQVVLKKLRDAQVVHALNIRDVCFLPEPELHSRSEGTTPYALARDPEKYALERVFAAAELCSRVDSSKEQEFLKLLKDSDSAVRYWGMIGLLCRGPDAVLQHEEALQKALMDESSSVRVVAAQALALHSNEILRTEALKTLLTLASPDKKWSSKRDVCVTAIESLGEHAAPIIDEVGRIQPNGPSPDKRYSEYVGRLIATITSKDVAKPTTALGDKPK